MEPIDGAAIHQAREGPQPVAEGRADRGHANHDVQVLPALLHVPREDLGRAVPPSGVRPLAALLRDLQLVLVGVQVRHLARVQDRAHLLQEGLLRDLRVGEEEHHVLHGGAGLHQHLLHVLVPLVHAVAFGHFDLEELELGDVRREGGCGLPAAAADADEQGVAQRQLQDPDHAADVLDERAEQHELHADLADGIVIVKALGDLRQQLLRVLTLHVARGFGVHEIGEDDRLGFDHLIVCPFQMLVHLPLRQIEEPIHVLLGRQAVLEDALALVHPHLAQVVDLRQGLARALANALEHLGHVAHVEGVMRLRRRRQHLLQHDAIHLQGRGDRPGGVARHVPRHAAQELVDHRGEDPGQAVLVEGRDEDQVEVPRVAVRDVVLPCPWRAHGRQHAYVDELTELPALAVVPAEAERRLDEHLPEDLDGGLGAVLLLERHVQIVDEHEHLLARRRAEGALLPLVQLAVNHILGLVGGRLRGEREGDGAELVGAEAIQQRALDGRRLRRACRPADQEVEAPVDERADDELVAARVRCGHDDGVVLRVLGHVEPSNPLSPLFPLGAISAVDVPIVEQTLAWRRRHRAAAGDVHLGEIRHKVKLLQQVLLVVHASPHDVADEQAAVRVRARAARPQHCEPEQLRDDDLPVHEALAHVHVVVRLRPLRQGDRLLAEHVDLVVGQ
mmetsp:Transcript_39913/g.120544  ORF Transcript_39913/g.120544 Transcript_39913/m.120544 type:complete len:676 (+) Transcript_39913:4712-6739(+)